MDKYYDIAVVGAGPSGLCFSASFQDTNLKIILLEKDNLDNIKKPVFDSRDIALTHISKNILIKLGIWDKIPQDKIYPLNEAKVVNGISPYQLYFPRPKKTSKGESIDRLGNLISNHLIKKAAYDKVKELPNIDLLTSININDFIIDDNNVKIILDNKETLNAKLLVVADSRLSSTRQKLGIPTDMHNFGRTVITFRIEHTSSNNHTAVECFLYGKTMAILPLEEYLSNIVITVENSKLDYFLQKTKEELALEVLEFSNGKLGEIKIVTDLHTYPLLATHAKKFYSKRSALIGDSAVGMHPVTAHGFNLGLKSIDILSNVIKKNYKKQKDIGDINILEEYNFKHMLNTKPLYHGTNAIVKIFTAEEKPMKFIRSSIMRFSNNLPIIKSIISKKLTG